MFRIGQKVVCVDEVSRGYGGWEPGAQIFAGQTYTVRRAFVDWSGHLVLHLNEVSRGEEARLYFGDVDLGYGAYRFRPLVSRQTSIEIFKKLLVPGTRIRETVE